MTFGTLIEGRTIARVGPAKPYRDQSAEIEAHDLVYRVGFINRIPPEYGTRTDIAFLNGAACRQLYADDMAEYFAVYDDVPWLVMKHRNGYRRQGHYKHARPMKRVSNPNQATMALYDLLQYEPGPASITVYGVDLYSAGPGEMYHENYLNWGHLLADPTVAEVASHASAFLSHDPWQQMRSHRNCFRSGKVIGDERYLAAVQQTDEEYQTVIDRWQAVLEEARS